MNIRNIALSVAFCLATAPAIASSYDCATAKTSREVLVCTNPLLSFEDSRLGALYTTALASLPSATASQLRITQRAWLRGLDQQCPISAASRDYAAINCLSNAYGARIKTIALMPERETVMAAPADEPDQDAKAIITVIRAKLPQLAASSDGIVNAIFAAGILQPAQTPGDFPAPPDFALQADISETGATLQEPLYVPALKAGALHMEMGADHVESWLIYRVRNGQSVAAPTPDVLLTDLSDNSNDSGAIGTDGHDLVAVMGGVCDYKGGLTVGVQSWNGTSWSWPYVLSVKLSSCASGTKPKILSIISLLNWQPMVH